MAHLLDSERLRRTDYKAFSCRFALLNILRLLIVMNVPCLHSLYKVGISLVGYANSRQRSIRFLHKISRLCQDYDIFVKSLPLHEFERNGIRNASVYKLPFSDFNGPGCKRHGRGSLDPLEVTVQAVIELVINRFSGLKIRGHNVKLHRILYKSFRVKRIKYSRNLFVTEV